MFNILPLILILISLAVILSIVVKKFPVLANLDVETIQAEREAKFKEQIVSNRLKRNFFRYYSRVAKIAKPVATKLLELLKWSYNKLLDFKDNYNKEEVIGDSEEAVGKLFSEIEELMKKDEIETVEKKLIEVIGIDSKNDRAFRLLGEVYFDRKDFNEAKQTWEHALKLVEKEISDLEKLGQDRQAEKEKAENVLAEIYYDLAQVGLKMENLKDSLFNIREALVIEPNNPRYLDTKLEISIIKKDKHLAERTFEKLKQVNPENQKLDDLKAEIDKI